jgi:hypothetical protein
MLLEGVNGHALPLALWAGSLLLLLLLLLLPSLMAQQCCACQLMLHYRCERVKIPLRASYCRLPGIVQCVLITQGSRDTDWTAWGLTKPPGTMHLIQLS